MRRLRGRHARRSSSRTCSECALVHKETRDIFQCRVPPNTKLWTTCHYVARRRRMTNGAASASAPSIAGSGTAGLKLSAVAIEPLMTASTVGTYCVAFVRRTIRLLTAPGARPVLPVQSHPTIDPSTLRSAVTGFEPGVTVLARHQPGKTRSRWQQGASAGQRC